MKQHEVGIRLYEKRVREHLSLLDVARKTGISVSTLSRVEIGKTRIGRMIVCRLAAFIGESLETERGALVAYYPEKPITEIVQGFLSADSQLSEDSAQVLGGLFKAAYEKMTARQ